ncbi:DUF6520 family protein [Mesonia sp. K4-1]|uniref:DUF6520 family protein n=1 Tax=Mesonia sp. K4-1 TaxID=2602760 RepID=UPI0011C76C24|nr:DUF6520 family protein [Mesonia sp. K4-1]TXK75047.1 hypothetical protein FT986_11105 [Mesonia sp. K4-1]
MKNKFLIPVLAMIFATGLSFATAEKNKQAVDYIHNGSSWMAIPEIDCGTPGARECQVRLQDGTVYSVYDLNNFGSLKKTISKVPFQL